MRIMVQGGAGYIGSVLVPMLQDTGHDVVVVDQLWFGAHLPPGTRVVSRQLFDLQEHDLRGFDAVLFLAGLSNDAMAEYSPAKNFVMNAALPSYMAYLARQAGVPRFVFASSCSVYGFTGDAVFDEESPPTCVYPYGLSKLQGERGVLQLRRDGFAPIALRLGTVCGYSPRMRFDLMINTMFKCAFADGRIVVNNPSVWRPLLDVRDAAEAFVQALGADPSVHGCFNVAYDNFTVGQVGAWLRDEVERLSGAIVGLEIGNDDDCRNYRVSCDKAREKLGFRPHFPVPEIVRNLYEHCAKFGDFSDNNYYNIRVFRRMEETAAAL